MSLQERLKEEIEALRTLRDELRVQVHLGKTEARELWESLEKQWQHLEGRAHVMSETSRESLDEIEEAGKLLVEEIRDGYRALRELL